ncbi:family 78 glycoside hydrolase catalytic domain [Bianquea renquensis]|uniref:alpha-L-rhamnosidase n=1 Tax=Bianquea renquensis TaxID=2763661 RepID=A0A926I1J1_9FIRM|nr:family 78 glycoside hydrolase catalytic domain [Bianquea renquensis]MBC8543051.1 family 78 glycoside hydrolase catalytic domain [Bianquea renquensis]
MVQDRITGLRVNYLENPLGLDSAPRFFWQILSQRRGAQQCAYEIRVSSTLEQAQAMAGDVYASGRVLSSVSTHVELPNGVVLQPRCRYYWSVSAWNEQGERLNSEIAIFETGKRGQGWSGNWITASFLRKMNEDLQAPYLRRSFAVPSPVREARLYICGLGYFEAYLNGVAVSDDMLCTAYTRFDKTVLYRVFDVTAQIREGQNALGVLLGNGWYNCFAEDPWNSKEASWRDVVKMLAELHLAFEDGSEDVIVTDPRWKCHGSPIIFNGIRNGEHYDARLELPGWNEAGFDDQAWENCRIVRGPGGALKAFEMEPIRICQVHRAVSKWAVPGGWIFDIGQNQAGIGDFCFHGKAGTTITVRYSDLLHEDGTLNMAMSGFIRSHGFQTDQYTKKSDEPECWHPRFVYHGFQYIEITGTDVEPELADVRAFTMHNDFSSTGEFSCSDGLLNRLQSLCWWSTVSNCFSVPTDCPHREKNAWTGDAGLSCEQMLINFGSQAFWTKWMGDVRDAQRPAGSIPVVIPSTGWGYNSMNGPDWASALTTVPWMLYLYHRDVTALRENYEAIRSHCEFMLSMADGYLVHYGLGDWCPPFDGPAISANMSSFKCPTEVTDNAYFHSSVRTLARMARILGYEEDASRYEEVADEIRGAFRRAYYDPETKLVAGDCQTATAAMLYHGLAFPEEQAELLDVLLKQIERQDWHIDFGVLGMKAVMHTLGSMGRSDVGYRMLAQRSYPSVSCWIEQGATTMWECWNGGGSHNHQVFSDFSAFLYKYIGGISPDESDPGFDHILLRPALTSGLSAVSCKVHSLHGEIRCSWSKEGDAVQLEVHIPVGSCATLYLPEHSQVLEDDRVWLDGDAESAIQLVSGQYRLVVATARSVQQDLNPPAL